MIDKISDGLIAGEDKGLTDLLKFLVDLTTGVASATLPAPLKTILDVTKPILNILKNYNNAMPTGTGGVTNLATTMAAAIATATPIPNCVPLIGPIKDILRGFLVTIESLPLGPEASKLLKIAVGTNLTAYFDNGIDSTGSTVTLLANTLPQIVDVIKGLQKSLGPVLDIADHVLQVLYDFVCQLTKASQDLAASRERRSVALEW